MELWDRDFDGTLETKTLYDESEDRLYMTTSQDVQPVADLCKNARDNFRGFSNTLNLVASVPMVDIIRWKNEGFDAFSSPIKEIQKKLNEDNLNKFLAYEKGYKKYHNGVTMDKA